MSSRRHLPTPPAGWTIISATDPQLLKSVELQPIVAEAIRRWAAAGLDATHLNVMRCAVVSIANLGESYVGLAESDLHSV